MRLLTLAAGAAVGYVLGARAGREKYEQIVASTGRLRANPTAGQAVQTVQELFSAPAPAAAKPVKAVPAAVATPGPTSTPVRAVPATSTTAAAPTPGSTTTSTTSTTSTAAPKPRKRAASKAAPKTAEPGTPSDLDRTV
ncbi:hypothetical protein ACQP2P_22800 [Dactylosporangium sp. CA-139114]|uniref:hypothetical protein n=1 Tax=Dactylosporangium sp. CA-139114 TaxID=3239931 RepID=UPI003D96D530